MKNTEIYTGDKSMTDKKENAAVKALKEKLEAPHKSIAAKHGADYIRTAFAFAEGYKKFLDEGRTERLAAAHALHIAKAEGFTEFDPAKTYKAGDRVFVNNRGKAAIFAVIGEKPLTEGIRVIAAHLDAPRIDLKQNPLYEEGELAFFKTHYYGGIKKYQWPALPLILTGVVFLENGAKVPISVGDEAGDPVLVITDLLPHLSQTQYKRNGKELVKGEELNVLVGSLPLKLGEGEDNLGSVKLNILKLLNDKYGIIEADFRSAELSLVPAFDARDVGFDRSLVGAYGHDDRVCSYCALKAVIDTKKPLFTSVAVLTDKEEVGSDGPTGLQSRYFENFINDLADTAGVKGRHVLSAGKCLSADVSAAFDPTFPDVLEKNNSAFIGYGPCLSKFTGSGGKSGTNDADAEFLSYVRGIFVKDDISWQTCELGKVDHGGGGTVAKYISKLDVDTVDLGVPVLSMHAPFECVSKTDVYETYRAFAAFLK